MKASTNNAKDERAQKSTESKGFPRWEVKLTVDSTVAEALIAASGLQVKGLYIEEIGVLNRLRQRLRTYRRTPRPS